jgi:hypothetical protein
MPFIESPMMRAVVKLIRVKEVSRPYPQIAMRLVRLRRARIVALSALVESSTTYAYDSKLSGLAELLAARVLLV